MSDHDVVVRSKATSIEKIEFDHHHAPTESDDAAQRMRFGCPGCGITFSRGHKGKTQIEYQIDADPGGMIPAGSQLWQAETFRFDFAESSRTGEEDSNG